MGAADVVGVGAGASGAGAADEAAGAGGAGTAAPPQRRSPGARAWMIPVRLASQSVKLFASTQVKPMAVQKPGAVYTSCGRARASEARERMIEKDCILIADVMMIAVLRLR